MSVHEIDPKFLSVVVLPSGTKYRASRVVQQERACSFAYFTIGELQRILNEIRISPRKEVHRFVFRNRRFLVRIYEAPKEAAGDSVEEEDPYTMPLRAIR